MRRAILLALLVTGCSTPPGWILWTKTPGFEGWGVISEYATGPACQASLNQLRLDTAAPGIEPRVFQCLPRGVRP